MAGDTWYTIVCRSLHPSQGCFGMETDFGSLMTHFCGCLRTKKASSFFRGLQSFSSKEIGVDEITWCLHMSQIDYVDPICIVCSSTFGGLYFSADFVCPTNMRARHCALNKARQMRNRRQPIASPGLMCQHLWR